jgi:hypothetical protein
MRVGGEEKEEEMSHQSSLGASNHALDRVLDGLWWSCSICLSWQVINAGGDLGPLLLAAEGAGSRAPEARSVEGVGAREESDAGRHHRFGLTFAGFASLASHRLSGERARVQERTSTLAAGASRRRHTPTHCTVKPSASRAHPCQLRRKQQRVACLR